MITLTEKAAEKVRELAKEDDLVGQGLRVRIMGGGCSGFTYNLYFEEAAAETDETIESQGIALYVDPQSALYLEGTEIDYVESLSGSGFKFTNPNVSGTCGCGSSFSA